MSAVHGDARVAGARLGRTRRVAFYGKGGIGKSTTSANMAAAASTMGIPTMVVGCDPKADSIRTLVDQEDITTLLDAMRQQGAQDAAVQSCVYTGFNGIVCVESGGPAPGVGCAGKGVAVALDALRQRKLLGDHLKLIVFDVLGDVVCGGFAQPMRQSFAEEVYVVTSGEYMALYQAINIAASVASMAELGCAVRMAGVICNKRNVPGEDDIVDYAAELIGAPVVMRVPRMEALQRAEARRKTLVELYPQSAGTELYAELARRVCANTHAVVPRIADRHEALRKLREYIRRHDEAARSPEDVDLDGAGELRVGGV